MRISNPWIFSLFLIRVNKTSITKIKGYSEIGSPWWAPLFNWKYCVVFPLLITQDSDLFKMASIHLIKLVPKPNLYVQQEEKSDLS